MEVSLLFHYHFFSEEKRKIAHYHQEHLVCQPSLSHHYTVLPTPTKINNIKVTFLLDNLNPKPNISRYFNLDLTIVLAGSYFNQNTVSSQALKLSNLHIVICMHMYSQKKVKRCLKWLGIKLWITRRNNYFQRLSLNKIKNWFLNSWEDQTIIQRNLS